MNYYYYDPENPRRKQELIEWAESVGKPFIAEEKKADRTIVQNKHYWGLIEKIGNHLGYHKDEMHKTMKEYFKIESTKKLTKEEFTNYIHQVEQLAGTEFGIVFK